MTKLLFNKVKIFGNCELAIDTSESPSVSSFLIKVNRFITINK